MDKSTFFTGQPIFSQVLSLIPKRVVREAVRKHNSARYYKKLKSYDHLVAMLYATFQRCTSLREVTTGLMACQQKIAHLGLHYIPRRSTLADGNMKRTSDFFASIHQGLYDTHYRSLPDSRTAKSLESRLYLMDSTTIKLFSEVMKGAGPGPAVVNGKKKGGAKAHMIINAQEDVPAFVKITHASKNDKELFSMVNLPKGSILVFDKGYNSYEAFDRLDKQNIFWITRMSATAIQEHLHSRQLSKKGQEAGVLADDLIRLGRTSNRKRTGELW